MERNYGQVLPNLEAPGAFANGAEGVGLFRTEMLYMDRDSAIITHTSIKKEKKRGFQSFFVKA